MIPDITSLVSIFSTLLLLARPAVSEEISICRSGGEVVVKPSNVWSDLYSTNYPRAYRNNEDCPLHINAQDGYIRTKVVYFNMEENFDFLKKYVEDEEMILTGNLNKRGSKTFTAIEPSIRLHYQTDKSYVKRGFHIRFKHKCFADHLPVGIACFFIVSKDGSRGHDAHYETQQSYSYAKRSCNDAIPGASPAKVEDNVTFKKLHDYVKEHEVHGQSVHDMNGYFYVNTGMVGWGTNDPQHINDYVRGRRYVICQY